MDASANSPTPAARSSKLSKPSKDTPTPETDKPVTVLLPESLIKKAKVLGAVTGESISEMVAKALEHRVRKDLAAALTSLQE